jgi:hypothetical protein
VFFTIAVRSHTRDLVLHRLCSTISNPVVNSGLVALTGIHLGDCCSLTLRRIAKLSRGDMCIAFAGKTFRLSTGHCNIQEKLLATRAKISQFHRKDLCWTTTDTLTRPQCFEASPRTTEDSRRPTKAATANLAQRCAPMFEAGELANGGLRTKHVMNQRV